MSVSDKWMAALGAHFNSTELARVAVALTAGLFNHGEPYADDLLLYQHLVLMFMLREQTSTVASKPT